MLSHFGVAFGEGLRFSLPRRKDRNNCLKYTPSVRLQAEPLTINARRRVRRDRIVPF
jgi:hypothetical protein